MNLLPDKYDKYLRFLKFIIKYWNSDIFSKNEDELKKFKTDKSHSENSLNPSPQELADDLKEMGPTYIKLGQLLSTRPDILPAPYLHALTQLQDNIEPVSFEKVESIFQKEIGTPIAHAFSVFHEKPLASASIGQVHEARLFSGEKVAVKIQRPDTQRQFIEDLETLTTLAEKAEEYTKTARKFSVHNIIEELKHILLQELDYTKEAQNLGILKENMKSFQYLKVPSVYRSYSSEKVLTMELIEGQKVTQLSPSQLIELPKKALVDDLIKGYLKQIIVDGFAHADPHPGNVHITADHKLALLDLGMIAQFDNRLQENILKLMIGLSHSDGDHITNVLLEMSDFDDQQVEVHEFRRMVIRRTQESKHSKAKDLQTGRDILEINQLAVQHGIQLPVELTILGKILLNIDQIIACLSPQHEIQKTVKKYIEQLMKRRTFNDLKSGSFLESLLESRDLAKNLPHRLNKITENLAANKFRVKLDAIDENRFLYAFQKVANRISISLIIAALILGAALIMRIPTRSTLWGYPTLAILLFLSATCIGLYLVYQILFKDESEPKK